MGIHSPEVGLKVHSKNNCLLLYSKSGHQSATLVSPGALIHLPEALWELFLSFASKEMVDGGFFCHKYPTQVAHVAPEVPEEELAALAGEMSSIAEAKSSSPSCSPQMASSRPPLVQKSPQEL